MSKTKRYYFIEEEWYPVYTLIDDVEADRWADLTEEEYKIVSMAEELFERRSKILQEKCQNKGDYEPL